MKARIPNYEWEIVVDSVDDSDPKYPLVYRTVGFAKFGFGGEVMVAGTLNDDQRIARLLNSFCMMMKQGDEFALDATHVIDYEDGSSVRFNICKYAELNGHSVKYQLIPDFEKSVECNS